MANPEWVAHKNPPPWQNGQVGWELQRSLAPLGEVIALDRNSRLNTGKLQATFGLTLPAWSQSAMCSANGASPTTTQPWPRFATILRVARFKFRYMQTGQAHELVTSGEKAEIVETVPGRIPLLAHCESYE